MKRERNSSFDNITFISVLSQEKGSSSLSELGLLASIYRNMALKCILKSPGKILETSVFF